METVTCSLVNPVTIASARRTPSATALLVSARESMIHYYEPASNLPALTELIDIEPARAQLISNRVASALRVIIHNAMRSCEYLQLTTADSCGHDRYVVQGRKGSGSYMVHLPDCDRQLLTEEFKLTPRSISGVQYSELYRALCKLNYGLKLAGHKNTIRTHAGRHDLIRFLSLSRPNGQLADLLRHKSTKAITHYGAQGV